MEGKKTRLFNGSSADGYLDGFCILAIVNRAATKVRVHLSYQMPVIISFGYIHRSGIAKWHEVPTRREDILLCVTMWMDLECTMVSDISQRKASVVLYQLYVEFKEIKCEKNRVK